ncbi:hypothetical protein SSTU70S_01501 [Stutzerimonas stutzeri]
MAVTSIWHSIGSSELAAKTEDLELQAHFAPLAKTLTENEATIVAELNAAQGKPVDIGGYYRSNPELTSKVMRPSQTFKGCTLGKGGTRAYRVVL